MLARTRDRLARLETEILPKPRVFAAFKVENSVGQHDVVAEVSFTFGEMRNKRVCLFPDPQPAYEGPFEGVDRWRFWRKVSLKSG
jgi:hypothetical protein